MPKFALCLLLLSSVVPAQQRVAAPSGGQARLSTVAMIDLPGRPGFGSIAMANNLAVISHSGSNSIDIFDPQKRRLVAQINNVGQPRGIAVDAKNERVYVAAANSIVHAISSQDWQVKDSFTVEGNPDVLQLSPDGLKLYVGDKVSSTIHVVDVSQRKSIANTQLQGRPEAIIPAENGNIFVSVQDQSAILVLDPQLKVVSTFKLQASQPTAMVYDPSSKRIYVAVRAAVLAIDANNGAELSRVPATRGVNSLVLDINSRSLFAGGGGSVMAFNLFPTLSGRDELPADVKGHSLTYDATHKLLLMPGGREGRSKVLLVHDLVPGAVPDMPPGEAQVR